MLDRIEADHPAGDRFSDPGQHIIGTKHLEQAQDLDELPLARLAHAGLEQPAQGRELFGQRPASQRSGLVERADLPLQQRQIVQRVEDEVLALIGARMTRDLLGAAGDYHLVDIATDQHFAVAIGGRHRVVHCRGSAPGTTS